ncbi:MAG: T9SS type A sorting domain-containing protein, partial [Ignavibacterium sp.]|nr:T9SS type A sorting domain-containing protein [Ignavibacterium sp.]MDW8376052.1 T9SS type A sorting domain-containing protein [Ignavibacteriales bacterium]
VLEVKIKSSKEFSLQQNYPNPFNSSTRISWKSPISGWHTIKLFDLLGREVETIVEGFYESGYHSTLYIINSSLPSGVYFYQLKVGDYIQTKKLIFVK